MQKENKVFTDEEYKAIMLKARLFARDNLKECCRELIEWDNTGILEGRYVKDLSRILKPLDTFGSLRLAQELVKSEALKFINELI